MRQRRTADMAAVVAGALALMASTGVAAPDRRYGAAAVPAHLFGRDAPDYSDVVCKPAAKNPANLPPCVQIENIEIMCTPNGTEPIYLLAHAECMCGGSFFAEWNGCQQCLYVHGLRSDRDMAFYSSVISTVSTELCDATTAAGPTAAGPSAAFSAIFSSVAEAEPPVSTGATTTSDRFPGETDVSLYFTPTGSLGPGPITGSATQATNTNGLVTAPPQPSSTSNNPFPSAATTRSGASSTTKSTNAAPTPQVANALVGVAAIAA